MRKIPVFFIIILLLFGCGSSKKMNLVWQDEFNSGKTFDELKWSKIPRGNSDWSRHMSNDERLFDIKNGNLVLRGIENQNFETDSVPFLTGGIYTLNKKHFGYGRLEIRAKLQGAQGAWPAFWMLPKGSKWPHTGEIDIMERLNYDSIVYQTIHTDYTYKLGIKNNPISGVTAKINPDDYNIYAVEKYPDSLVFFVNNKRTFAYPRIETDKVGQYPFSDHDFYLLIDMQLGGKWVGKVDPADLPVEMHIDWVRFYENKKLP